MTNITWTNAQKHAIKFNEPERLLVSAAAGSGKTAVLTERITVRALKNIVKPSRLLVVTFTELAANKMKAKIMSSFRDLRDTAKDAYERDRIDRLIRELPLARISTIHAFCNHILSSYLAEFTDKEGKPYLEPGYEVLQGTEEEILRDEAVDTVLTTLFTEVDRLEQHEAGQKTASAASTISNRPERRPKSDEDERDFHATVPRGIPDLSDGLTPFVLGGRDCSYADWLRDFKATSIAYAPKLNDKPFRESIVRMLGKLRSLPYYRRLIADAYEKYMTAIASFPDCVVIQYWWKLFDETLRTASSALDELRNTSHYSRIFDELDKWRKKGETGKKDHMIHLALATEEMEDVVTALTRSSGRSKERWDEIVQIGQTLPELQVPRRSATTSSTNQKVIDKNNYIEQFLREILPLTALISNKVKRTGRNEQYISHHPPVFTILAETAKQSMLTGAGQVARFLEVTLLVDNEYKKMRFGRNAALYSDFEHGVLAILEKDEIRESISQLYDEIYIDEYQDTSSIQDAIISAIDRRNVFMVGDIKQSIYRFRYANPQLFSARVNKSQVIDHDQPFVPSLSSHQLGYLSLMNRNFRSRPGIIEFVNDFFSAFLTESVGEIEYDETQMFEIHRARAEQTEEPNPRHFPEVLWEIATNCDNLDDGVAQAQDEEDSSDSLTPELPGKMSKVESEAFIAARVIGELLDAGAKPETIAVLLRTNDHCRQFEEVLSAYGIPVASRSGRIFPDNLVSRQVEALLAVLDNPRQDIPLISTMVGPFAPVPFTSEELANIGQTTFNFNDEENDKSGTKGTRGVTGFFHDRLRFFCKTNLSSDIAEKMKQFDARMKRWRMLATELDARELLDTIFLESDYVPYITRGDLGASHYRELEQLTALFEPPDRTGSFGVRSMLAQLQKALGQSLKDDDESTLVDGAVHVLTRHSSKGLEWDYVLLGGLDASVKGRSNNDRVFFSELYGLSSYTIDEGGLTVYNNAFNEAFRLSENRLDRAESWRLLYVAMTRAKERLILISPIKKTLGDIVDIKTILEEADHLTAHLGATERTGRTVVPESLSANAKDDLELILSVLAVREPARTKEMVEASEGYFKFSYLDASVTPFSKIVAAVEERQRQNKVADEANHLEPDCHSVKTTASEVDAIATLLSATIPHSKAASTPAKITVTELNKRLSDDAFNQPLSSGESPEPLAMTLVALTDDVSGEDDPSVNRGKNGKDGTPIKSTIIRSDMALTLREREESDQIKGATLGTLMHFIFQFIDIDKLARQATADGERICLSELRSMADADMITKEQEKAALPFVPQIVAWAKSSLAARLLEAEKATGRVYREMPFTMAIAASELRDDFPDDEITLVQGMIDLWFVEENEKVVLIDFKTDRLTFDTDEQADDEILRRYSTQIRYYAEAITKATEREVSEALIWLVRYARHVSVPLD